MTQYGDMTDQAPGSGHRDEDDRDHRGASAAKPESSAAPATASAADSAPVLDGEQPSRPGPSSPSPYLAEGQAVPEAYPAPPQRDQPRYGVPAGSFIPDNGLRPGQQSFLPTAYAQRGYGQPVGPYRQSAMGRMGPGGRAALRDPALAAVWERLLASALDWLLIFAAAFLVLLEPMLRFWRELNAIFLNAQTLTPAEAQTAMNNLMHSSSTTTTLLSFGIVVSVIALAYYWVLLARWGATLGKQALGLRVVSSADRSRPSVKAAGLRTGAFLVGPVIMLLGPGVFELAGSLLWAADCLSGVVDPGLRCMHDRVAGTSVVRKRSLS